MAARHMMELEPCSCPTVVDDMSNAANVEYTAFPERLFVILDGRIVFHGGQGTFLYKVRIGV